MDKYFSVRPARLIFLLVIFALTGPNWLRIAAASPTPAPGPRPHLRDGTLENIAETMQVVNLTRQHEGDIFTANELLPACNMDTCVGLSSGTAGLFVPSREAELLPGHEQSGSSGGSGNGVTEKCQCRCLQHLNTYREDLGICVDDIHECTLSPFVSGSSSEKIPFVFLPLRGQIIHPSKEINFPGVKTPICAVTSAQYLTQKGWLELRNPIDADVPFRLFRDEGRTFLQWLGETDLRHRMEGRLILVHMMCRDMAAVHISSGSLGVNPKNIFTPCVAFRVNGSPTRYLNNVPEVLFQSENSNLSAPPGGFHTKEYIVIGICSLILGLIYVASVFLYLHVKKRKSQSAKGNKNDADLKNPKNDQLSYIAPFARTESFYSGLNENRHSQRSNRSHTLSTDEMGIVKNNPLLRHFASLSDNSGFVSDRSNSNSECEDVRGKLNDRSKNLQTAAIIHPSSENGSNGKTSGDSVDGVCSQNQDNECLPEANVSITEENAQDDKNDHMKAVVNGTVRKKLYFNPAYFEPHLLMSPPPAAVEFLTKIREVIAIAKYKMATKRYQPSLNIIPEEQQTTSDIFAKANKPQTETVSSKAEHSNHLVCSGCPGCSTSTEAATKCENCGDKHQSIQKWLEGVPFNEGHASDVKVVSNEIDQKGIDKIEEISEESGSYKKNTKSPQPRKKVPPPLPLTAPKIISHSLKPQIQNKSTSSKEESIYIKSTSSAGNYSKSPVTPVSPINREKEMYGFRKAGGSEIYNNPKFMESPQLSMRSRTSSSKRRSSKKKVEVHDQYSIRGAEEQSHYEMLKSIQHMPDMVYEALAKDYSIRNFSTDKNSTQLYNIPTPDYDGTYSKKMKEIYNNSTGSGPFVPTPDYSTLSKRSLRQFQPDSPIYRRRSPQYLIVDYETDSLERGSSMKKECNSSSPLSNNSSDISSQPSPSLSTALPLEEEVEVHHTVYDKVDGFRKDGDTKKKIAGDYDLYSRYGRESSPKIKYDTPFRGSMTIEVAHEPQSDELSTDSDQFEPDTLDRKPKKQNSGSFRSLNAWTDYLNKSQSFVNNNDKVSYSSLENMTSLPAFTNRTASNEQLILRSSNSFRNNSEQFWTSEKIRTADNHYPVKQNFGSLREIYQSKVQQQSNRPRLKNLDFDEPGRLLTLDTKHVKRQRQDIGDRIKKLMPPDVIPSDKNHYYDIPRSSEKVNGLIIRKNSDGWSTSDSSGMNDKRDRKHDDSPSPEDTDAISDHSESTEITGVSDTQINSESHNSTRKHKTSGSLSSIPYSDNDRILQIDYSAMYNQQKQDLLPAVHNSSNSFISVKIGNDNAYQTYHFNSINTGIYSMPDTMAPNNQLLTNLQRIDEGSCESKSCSATSPTHDLEPHMMNIQRVYRVEVPPPSNGMQIAMGLRDRAKKSKDLKNAWKKFVSMATGKFNASGMPDKDNFKDCDDSLDHKSVLSESTDRDEGIASLIHDNSHVMGIRRSQTSSGSLENLRKTDHHNKQIVSRSHSSINDFRVVNAPHCRLEMDSGYISGEECKPYAQQMYDRCSVEATSRSNSDGINIINTNPDTTINLETCQNATRRRPQTPKARKHPTIHHQVPTTTVKSNNNSIQVDLKHPIDVSVYSSEEEQCTSPTSCSDSDDGGNTEDMGESGAESIETHSVLFKNVRHHQKSDGHNGVR